MAAKKVTKDEWFMRELTNASAEVAFQDAAHKWRLSHFDHANGNGHENCQLCHTRIVNVVVIHNPTNDMVLRIGHDCYDKLLQYLATHRVEAVTLPNRQQSIRGIKQYIKRNIDAAMLSWLKNQPLPDNLQQALRVVDALGYTPSLKDAEELVEYYKLFRLFDLDDLLKANERELRKTFPHLNHLPKAIALVKLEQLRRCLETGQRIKNRRVEKAREKEEERLRKYAEQPFSLENANLTNYCKSYETTWVILYLPFEESLLQIFLHFPRGTEKEEIEATVPHTIQLRYNAGKYTVDETEVDSWVERIKKLRQKKEDEKLAKIRSAITQPFSLQCATIKKRSDVKFIDGWQINFQVEGDPQVVYVDSSRGTFETIDLEATMPPTIRLGHENLKGYYIHEEDLNSWTQKAIEQYQRREQVKIEGVRRYFQKPILGSIIKIAYRSDSMILIFQRAGGIGKVLTCSTPPIFRPRLKEKSPADSFDPPPDFISENEFRQTLIDTFPQPIRFCVVKAGLNLDTQLSLYDEDYKFWENEVRRVFEKRLFVERDNVKKRRLEENKNIKEFVTSHPIPALLKLQFQKGENSKTKELQWECVQNGMKYILYKKDSYNILEGEIYVRSLGKLGPKTILVGRVSYGLTQKD